MKFTILDTQSTYRRLLDAPDAGAREAIFREELVAPFAGMAKVFGGDAMASFRQWGMWPEQFEGANRDRMRGILDQLAAADAWNRASAALDTGWAAFAAYSDRIRLPEVVFGLLVADMSGIPQAGGYTGFGGIPGWIMTVYGAPDEENLKRVEAATVHELHHNLAGSGSPQNLNVMVATLAEYMLVEGLAESFSAELYGPDKIGPWVSRFDMSRMDETKARFRAALGLTGFDAIRRYIFGDSVSGHNEGIPDYAGYALGYHVVQAYLAKTGKSVVQATFVPPGEIVEASGFFDPAA